MVNDFIKLVQKWKVQNDDEEESDESLSFCSRLTFIGMYKLLSTTKLVFSVLSFSSCVVYILREDQMERAADSYRQGRNGEKFYR